MQPSLKLKVNQPNYELSVSKSSRGILNDLDDEDLSDAARNITDKIR